MGERRARDALGEPGDALKARARDLKVQGRHGGEPMALFD
jgi:hypothetical protein